MFKIHFSHATKKVSNHSVQLQTLLARILIIWMHSLYFPDLSHLLFILINTCHAEYYCTPPQCLILLTCSIPFSIIVENSIDPDQTAADLDLQCFQKWVNLSPTGQGLIPDFWGIFSIDCIFITYPSILTCSE